MSRSQTGDKIVRCAECAPGRGAIPEWRAGMVKEENWTIALLM
jgi:hypothetical protein